MVERAEHHAPGGGAEQPPRPVPIKPPEEVNGFRFAGVVDGFDEDNRPRPWAARPWVENDEERERLLRYLRAGATLTRSDARTYDLFDPANPKRRWIVPTSYLTDGVWIWCEASVYYLQTHVLAPSPAFVDHIARQGYRCPPVEEAVRLSAREALFQRGRIEAELRAEYEQKRYLDTTPFTLVRGKLSNEPPTVRMDPDRFDEIDEDNPRFHLEVETALLGAGWLPGRDAAGRVDPWLEEFSAQADSRGRRHEIFPAARDIYRELGLLDITPPGRGEEVGAFPIHFFPEAVPAESVSTHWLAGQLRLRTFPIGRTEDDTNVLIVDEEGRIYMSHPAGEFFLGTGIEQALEVLVRGLKAPTLESRIDDLRSGRLAGTRRKTDG
jgi:hypothetical protein